MVTDTSNVVLDEFLETHLYSPFPIVAQHCICFVIQDSWRRLDDAICLAVYYKSEFWKIPLYQCIL